MFPAGLGVLEACSPLCRANDTLQPALVPDGGSSVSDGDGGGEDGLNDGRVEVHHHCLWQAEHLQLQQEVPSVPILLGEGADVQLLIEILSNDGAQEMKGANNGD
ncbi:hypothetical protein CHARACLAT_033518 [Characodon lateralis]|uniref:Uncharacterized protein n=1 Tax=Characodon lateralis TaxID=208331 RepID=A0ABU7EPL2_9TELE|nr:hypothetical protein [Characodon lateralis]